MDKDGDSKIKLKEFIEACLQDKELCDLLEGTMGQQYFTKALN